MKLLNEAPTGRAQLGDGCGEEEASMNASIDPARPSRLTLPVVLFQLVHDAPVRASGLIAQNVFKGISSHVYGNGENTDRIVHNTFIANLQGVAASAIAAGIVVRRNIFYKCQTGFVGDEDRDDTASDGPRSRWNLEQNVFWGNGRPAARFVPPPGEDYKVGKELEIASGDNRVERPPFRDPARDDYSLPPNAFGDAPPAGALDHIPFTSDWPVQDIERAFLRLQQEAESEE
jgi:hypothetical protein